MKSSLLVALVSVVLGSLIGVGTTAYQNRRPNYGFSKARWDGGGPIVVENKPDVDARPRIVVVGSRVFDFGVMSRDETRRHMFVVRNEGNAPLELRFKEKSCQCTDVHLSRSIVPPNLSTEITLSWKPNNYSLDFGQIARFGTNDPALYELDLTITGKVQQIVRPVPASLSFDNVPVDQGRSIQMVVYGYRHPDLVWSEVEFLGEETAKHFSAEVTPLDAEELKREPGARSGVAVSLHMEPGLPIGPFHQRIRLQTNKPDIAPIELPIQGAVVGKIEVLGSGYDKETGVLKLGTLSGSKEHSRRLWILARGGETAVRELKTVSTDPEGIIEALVEAPTQVGPLKKYPLSIRIKPDGRLINRLSSKQGSLGRIVLEVNGDESNQLIIYVSFLLEAS